MQMRVAAMMPSGAESSCFKTYFSFKMNFHDDFSYLEPFVIFAVSKRIESHLGFKFLVFSTNFFEPLGIVIAMYPRCF